MVKPEVQRFWQRDRAHSPGGVSNHDCRSGTPDSGPNYSSPRASAPNHKEQDRLGPGVRRPETPPPPSRDCVDLVGDDWLSGMMQGDGVFFVMRCVSCTQRVTRIRRCPGRANMARLYQVYDVRTRASSAVPWPNSQTRSRSQLWPAWGADDARCPKESRLIRAWPAPQSPASRYAPYGLFDWTCSP